MLNASEKFWIQSKPVSSCRALLPILIASGLNFNLNSPICLTHSLLSSHPLSFCRVLRICLNSAGFLVQQKSAIRLRRFSSFLIPLQHDAWSWNAVPTALGSPEHALTPATMVLLVEDVGPQLYKCLGSQMLWQLLVSFKNLFPTASPELFVCSFTGIF